MNFLGIIYNLSENSFKPSHKDKRTPFYITVNSNHPVSMIRQIPNVVNIRINRLSSNKKYFTKIIGYMMRTKKSGFKQRLEYLEILKDNFETCNNENNNNNNVKNNNDNNSNKRTMNGETTNRLNTTSDMNNNDSNCRKKTQKNRKKKCNIGQLPFL